MKRGKSLIVGVIFTIVTLLGFSAIDAATTMAITDSRDCDNGAIIYCGALSQAELQQKYSANTTRDLPAIYSHYGVSAGMIQNGSAKSGYVTQSGNVVYNGKTVATNAHTAGRLGYPSSRVITVGGTKLYEHTTQTSFRSSSIQAFIWFDSNGQFVTAILKSCGNPIRATPVKPQPQPVYACNSLTANKISRDEYSFTTSATAKNGARIVSYAYNFGDGTTKSGEATIRHTYAKAGTYRVAATVKVTVNGKTVNAPGTCAVTVTVAQEMCPIPGKTQYPKNDARCVENKPSVTIEKTVNGKELEIVTLNTPFNYEITVRNSGNVALKNALVTDKAPANVTFVSSSIGTITNSAWSYTIAELGVGQSRTFTITAKLTKFQSGGITNTACVESSTIPGNKDMCDTASIETPPPVTVQENQIQVCDTMSNTLITINENQFDSSHMTKDTTQCQTPVATAPVELPHTGINEFLGGSLGVGSLAGAVYHYGSSRRQLRKAMLRQ
jgi:uncharacterized repeat protein (TIGR01451 family)